ncbi:hypothetical protein LCGC14_2919670, partial [marine sediment metagenome]
AGNFLSENLFTLYLFLCIIRQHSKETLLGDEMQPFVKQGRTMNRRRNNPAYPDGRIQDRVPITIRTKRGQVLHQNISVNHFFERIEK